jgi:GINS complex protein
MLRAISKFYNYNLELCIMSSDVHSPSFADIKRHACSEFLAGDELITIVPSFSYPKPLELISYSKVGPFTAGFPLQVPLWMAILFQQKSVARIQAPTWMEVETLRGILRYEQETESFSPDLPFRYQEISKTVMAMAEMEDLESIRILLQDIATVRMDKIRRNLHTLSEQSLSSSEPLPVIDVTGIGSLELAAIEPFCRTAFQHHMLLSSSSKKQSSDSQPIEEAGSENHLSSMTKSNVVTTSRLRRFR